MIVDKLTEITSNALRFICPSPEVWNFDEKRLHWASVVRAIDHAPDMIGKEKLFTSK